MDRRYQIFLSSTFADLEDERKEVQSALQKAGYIVTGMETFPSDDVDSWEVIKRVIDQSDYYVLVIAGRYGSLGPNGISYTEMEYHYAKERGIPIMAFLHADPNLLPHKFVESDHPNLLIEFRKKVEKHHHRRTWRSKHELATEALASLSQIVNLRPQVGWVRGSIVEQNELISGRLNALQLKLDKLTEERDLLVERIESLDSDSTNNSDIAWGYDEVDLIFEVHDEQVAFQTPKVLDQVIVSLSWQSIFYTIAPRFLVWTPFIRGLKGLNRFVAHVPNSTLSYASINTIRIQLIALNMIEIAERKSDSAVFEEWKLTNKALGQYAVGMAKRKSSR